MVSWSAELYCLLAGLSLKSVSDIKQLAKQSIWINRAAGQKKQTCRGNVHLTYQNVYYIY